MLGSPNPLIVNQVKHILKIIIFLIPPAVIFSQNTTNSRMEVKQIIESALKNFIKH